MGTWFETLEERWELKRTKCMTQTHQAPKNKRRNHLLAWCNFRVRTKAAFIRWTRVLCTSQCFVAVVVQQKGQMVFKQIKQIANYSCYLSLIIGSFFILSLHISLRRCTSFSLFFSLWTVLHGTLSVKVRRLSVFSDCCFVSFNSFRFVHYLYFFCSLFVSHSVEALYFWLLLQIN